MTAPLSALEATARAASLHPLARDEHGRALFAVTVRMADGTILMLAEGEIGYNEGKSDGLAMQQTSEAVSRRTGGTSTMTKYITKQCPVCNKEFTRLACRAKRLTYCSKLCASRGWRRVRKPVYNYNAELNAYEIPLTRGAFAIVDEVDLDLANRKWQVHRDPRGNSAYAYGATPPDTNGHTHTIQMHRLILSRMLGRELIRAELTDHINHNGLDNRRSNLRLATHTQNRYNIGIRRNNTSGFTGVSRRPENNTYRSVIVHNGVRHSLGTFKTAEEAYAARAELERRLRGEFAYILPLSNDEEQQS
jgi:hypothetical protein